MALDRRKTALWDCIEAALLWVALGFSLGWYYTYAYSRAPGWPMPLPEACGAVILYYFSAFSTGPWIRVIHWLVLFPIAGFLWVTLLTLTAPFFGGKRTEYTWMLLQFALTSLPLIIPGPILAGMAGRTLLGFNARHIIEVGLLRAQPFYSPSWLTPLFVGLAVISLVWQVVLYLRMFETKGKKAVVHLLVSAFFLACMTCGLATFAAYPLGWWLG